MKLTITREYYLNCNTVNLSVKSKYSEQAEIRGLIWGSHLSSHKDHSFNLRYFPPATPSLLFPLPAMEICTRVRNYTV